MPVIIVCVPHPKARDYVPGMVPGSDQPVKPDQRSLNSVKDILSKNIYSTLVSSDTLIHGPPDLTRYMCAYTCTPLPITVL